MDLVTSSHTPLRFPAAVTIMVAVLPAGSGTEGFGGLCLVPARPSFLQFKGNLYNYIILMRPRPLIHLLIRHTLLYRRISNRHNRFHITLYVARRPPLCVCSLKNSLSPHCLGLTQRLSSPLGMVDAGSDGTATHAASVKQLATPSSGSDRGIGCRVRQWHL
jgi:hypothetical protein